MINDKWKALLKWREDKEPNSIFNSGVEAYKQWESSQPQTDEERNVWFKSPEGQKQLAMITNMAMTGGLVRTGAGEALRQKVMSGQFDNLIEKGKQLGYKGSDLDEFIMKGGQMGKRYLTKPNSSVLNGSTKGFKPWVGSDMGSHQGLVEQTSGKMINKIPVDRVKTEGHRWLKERADGSGFDNPKMLSSVKDKGLGHDLLKMFTDLFR